MYIFAFNNNTFWYIYIYIYMKNIIYLKILHYIIIILFYMNGEDVIKNVV